jgi:hypothetical protein
MKIGGTEWMTTTTKSDIQMNYGGPTTQKKYPRIKTMSRLKFAVQNQLFFLLCR